MSSKQKTAYEILVRDWSSDVCSSDLQKETGPGEYDWSSMTMKSFLNILSPAMSAQKSRVASRSFWRRELSSRAVYLRTDVLWRHWLPSVVTSRAVHLMYNS